MHKHPTHKSTSGFTLIELLIVIAIIGILAGIGIPQYTQYKIRGYDAHSKQALKDMHLLCNAYWLDTDALQGCDLPKIKDTYYGFNQNPDVAATLPPSPLNNFCASAKHNSSPNTYSIDSAAMISNNANCLTGIAVERAVAEKAVELAAIEYKKKYESCENISEEFADGNATNATFVPEKYFREAGSHLMENQLRRTWQYRGAMDSQPIKGYCVWFPSPGVAIFRRPGCNDEAMRKLTSKNPHPLGAQYEGLACPTLTQWALLSSPGMAMEHLPSPIMDWHVQHYRNCTERSYAENDGAGRMFTSYGKRLGTRIPSGCTRAGGSANSWDALRNFIADGNNSVFTNGSGDETDYLGRTRTYLIGTHMEGQFNARHAPTDKFMRVPSLDCEEDDQGIKRCRNMWDDSKHEAKNKKKGYKALFDRPPASWSSTDFCRTSPYCGCPKGYPASQTFCGPLNQSVFDPEES